MAQQTKAANLLKFEAGDRPTDQDFIDLFDSILFLNESNGLSSNNTTLLGDLNVGGSLNMLGGGSISISGSFSAGNPNEGVSNGRISAFTATSIPSFYASSSANTVLFQGVSKTTSASIMLSSDNDENSFVKYGIENGKGFLDAQGTTIISYSTGSAVVNTFADNFVHISASVGIGRVTNNSSYVLDVNGDARISAFALTDDGSDSTIAALFNHIVLQTSRDEDDLIFKGGDSTTEYIRIEGDTGNVGIGTNDPSSKFHVVGNGLFEGTSDPTITINHTDSGQIQFGITNGTAEAFILSTTNDAAREADIKFLTNDGTTTNEIVRFKEDGKVGIGIDAPTSTLHVIGDTKLVPDSTADNFITFTSVNSTQTNQHFYVSDIATWQLYSGVQNFHIRRTDTNPGDPSDSKDFVTFRGGNTTNATNYEGVEFHVGVTGSFQGDGSGLTGLVAASQVTVTNALENRLVTVNSATTGLDGEENLTFDASTIRLGIGDDHTPDATVHIVGVSDGTIPYMIMEGGGTVAEQDALLIRDLGTTNGNKNNVKFQATADDHTIAQIQVTTKTLNATNGGTLSMFTYSDDTGTANTDQLFLKNDGHVGIGTADPRGQFEVNTGGGTMGGSVVVSTSRANAGITLVENATTAGNSPELHIDTNEITQFSQSLFIGALSEVDTEADIIFRAGSGDDATFTEVMRIHGQNSRVGIGTSDPAAKLDVRGDIKIGSTPTMTLFDDNSISTGPDIKFASSGLIAAEDALLLNINSNAPTGTSDLFIRSGGETSTATEIARFTSDGKLGVGGVDPSVALHLKFSNNEGLRLENTDDGDDPFLSFHTGNNSGERRAYIQSVNGTGTNGGNELRLVSEAGEITFRTADVNGTILGNGVERMVIEAGGNVGIGTGAPEAKLHLKIDDNTNNNLVEVLHLERHADDMSNSAEAEGGYISLNVDDDSPHTHTELARISWRADNVNNFEGDGRIGFWTAKSTGGSQAGYALTEKMTIDRLGHVGIGTTTPITELEINTGGTSPANTDGNVASFQQAGGTGFAASIAVTSGNASKASIFFGDTDDQNPGGIRYNNVDDSLNIRTNDIDHQVTITADGMVSIGQETTPSDPTSGLEDRLYVQGVVNNTQTDANFSSVASFKNPTNATANQGVTAGIRLKLGSSSEHNKWAGIAAISEQSFSNRTGLIFWPDGDLINGGTSTQGGGGKMRLSAGGSLTLGVGSDGSDPTSPNLNASLPPIATADGNGAAPLLYLKSNHQGNPSSEDNLGGGIRFEDNDTNEYWDQSMINGTLIWSHKELGATEATKQFIANDDNTEEIIAFTGQHPCRPSTGTYSDYSNKVGYIVIASGNYNNGQFSTNVEVLDGPTINESLPTVKLSDGPNDKKVFGVISKIEDPNNSRTITHGKLTSTITSNIAGDERLWINSIGEGAIMVCNINGNLENGDYITTSHIEGLGMRQDDDLLHNYTVAKITQDCNFNSETTNISHNGTLYKAKLVGCTYHCG